MERALEVWEQDLSIKSENTRIVYRRNFKAFLDRWGVTAEELYAMRRADVKSEDTRDQLNVERMVKVLMAEMSEKGYAASTCRNVSKAMTSFFESQGLPLKIKMKDKPRGAYNGQRLAMVDHIKKMWDSCPIENQAKNRAILFFLKDAGIRISDLAELSVQDYREARKVTHNLQRFAAFYPIETEKMKVNAFIHIGPEGVEALDTYLEEPRTWTPTEKDPEEPLFLNAKGKRFTPNCLSALLSRLGEYVGTKKIGAHSLRKFHTTMLESAGVPDNWIKKLQGKKIRGSMAAYSLPEETGELFEAYVKAYPKITIFGEQVSAQKLDEQAQRIADLETQLEAERRNKIEESITVRNLEEKLKSIEPALELVMKFIEKERGVDRTREAVNENEY